MKFALIGAAGYIAPKHMEAIKVLGSELVCALDPHDSVGVLDSYFPECKFFTEFERYDRFLELNRIDYVSICSPNYMHDAHIRHAISKGCKVICEKPIVINMRNAYFGEASQIHPILQLRYHPELDAFKDACKGYEGEVYATMHSPRGCWYEYSWKGSQEKSGGIEVNIGIHMLDLLTYVFEDRNPVTISLSTDMDVKPEKSIVAGENRIDLNCDKNLHIDAYRAILAGRGFAEKDALPSIKLAEEMRNG